jgi:hypothetical protein
MSFFFSPEMAKPTLLPAGAAARAQFRYRTAHKKNPPPGAFRLAVLFRRFSEQPGRL